MAKAMTKSNSPLSKKPGGLNTIIDAIDDEIAISRGIERAIGGLEVLDEGARGGVLVAGIPKGRNADRPETHRQQFA